MTSAGWCCVVVMLQVLSFYAFHATFLCVVSPVATVAAWSMFIYNVFHSFFYHAWCCMSIFISLLSITLLFFQEIYKVLPVISFVGIANHYASLWCITSLTGDPMAPSTQGVNVASLIRSWLLLWPSSLCLSTSQRYSSSRRSMERQRDQKYSKHQENNCWTTPSSDTPSDM